jgi:hypothetical protein
VGLNLLGNRKRLAGQFQALRVKRLRHERRLAQKQEMALTINDIGRIGIEQQLPFARIERCQVNRAPRNGGNSRCVVEKVPAVGQEERPHVTDLSFIEHGGGGGRAASRGHFLENRSSRWGKNDHPVSAPRAPVILRSVTQGNGRPARDLNLLELPAREESEKTAVG